MYFSAFYILPLIGIAISMYASFKLNNTFSQYSNIHCLSGKTGAEVAKILLERMGIYDVNIIKGSGKLTDHYDPRSKVISLSDAIYSGTSLVSVSVAAHETGHAIQHATNYSPLTIRNNLVPVFQISTSAAQVFILIGLLFSNSGTTFLNIGIILLTIGLGFQIITLPVEFNASKRAIELLEENKIITSSETSSSTKILNAAALTYVAAALAAMLSLVRLVLISQSRNSRRRR